MNTYTSRNILGIWLFVSTFVCDSICPPTHSSIHLQCKISELALQFFLIYCMKLDSHKESKVQRSIFQKKVPLGLEGSKVPKYTKKWSFQGSIQKSSLFICTFLLKYESTNIPLTFRKNCMSMKIWFLNVIPKTSRSIRIYESLNRNISQTSCGMNLHFCM